MDTKIVNNVGMSSNLAKNIINIFPMKHTSLNIKYLRKINKLSQDDLAKIIDTKRTTISNWEMGVAHPKVEELIKLSAYFDISIDKLLFVDLSKGEGDGVGVPEPRKSTMVVDEPKAGYNKTSIDNQQNIQKLIEANANLSETIHRMSKNESKLMETFERFMEKLKV